MSHCNVLSIVVCFLGEIQVALQGGDPYLFEFTK
jgi:hypothetical protein